jgi:hypothetical protein
MPKLLLAQARFIHTSTALDTRGLKINIGFTKTFILVFLVGKIFSVCALLLARLDACLLALREWEVGSR